MEQFLSRVFQGLAVDFIPEQVKAWAHLPKHIPTSLFREQIPFSPGCFSNLNVEPMPRGNFREKACLGTEAKDNQQETVLHWVPPNGLACATAANHLQILVA